MSSTDALVTKPTWMRLPRGILALTACLAAAALAGAAAQGAEAARGGSSHSQAARAQGHTPRPHGHTLRIVGGFPVPLAGSRPWMAALVDHEDNGGSDLDRLFC